LEINKLNAAIVARSDSAFSVQSKQLYHDLFEDVAPHLEGNKLKIIPHRELFSLNFEVLINPSAKDNKNYLLQNYAISYLLSATTAIQYSQLARENRKGLLALAPGFFSEAKENYASKHRGSALFDIEYMKLIQQPFAVQTAQEISGLFNGEALLTAQATEKNFTRKAKRFGIIHLGTHTEINNNSPMLSRLVLSKSDDGEQDESNDGYLHAYEIYNMSLRAELAVLSACETGVGKKSSSEGVLSLAHSFAFAGCPAILMSLWQIDEKTSAEITSGFYKNISKGLHKDDALRKAKINYLKKNKGELAAPYYWSGIVLMGSNAPIKTEYTSPFWLYILIAGILVFILAAILWQQKRKARA
jgi:CHAT domain-containing protein